MVGLVGSGLEDHPEQLHVLCVELKASFLLLPFAHTSTHTRTQMADPDKWTLNLPPGPDCSVGYSSNEFVSEDGSSLPGRENEDK